MKRVINSILIRLILNNGKYRRYFTLQLAPVYSLPDNVQCADLMRVNSHVADD